jgi:hypothetical protein
VAIHATRKGIDCASKHKPNGKDHTTGGKEGKSCVGRGWNKNPWLWGKVGSNYHDRMSGLREIEREIREIVVLILFLMICEFTFAFVYMNPRLSCQLQEGLNKTVTSNYLRQLINRNYIRV